MADEFIDEKKGLEAKLGSGIPALFPFLFCPGWLLLCSVGFWGGFSSSCWTRLAAADIFYCYQRCELLCFEKILGVCCVKQVYTRCVVSILVCSCAARFIQNCLFDAGGGELWSHWVYLLPCEVFLGTREMFGVTLLYGCFEEAEPVSEEANSALWFCLAPSPWHFGCYQWCFVAAVRNVLWGMC